MNSNIRNSLPFVYIISHKQVRGAPFNFSVVAHIKIK